MTSPVKLFDSDAFIGLFVPKDAHHAYMVEYLQAMDRQWQVPMTTSAVVMETATYLSKKYHHHYAVQFLNFLTTADFEVHDISSKERVAAQRLFNELETAHNSLVDCCNVVIARQLGLDAITSFDKGYGTFNLEFMVEAAPL